MTSLSLFILQALYSYGWWTATYCPEFSSGFTCWLLRLEGRCPIWLHQLPASGSKWHASHTPWFIPQAPAPAAYPVETGHTNARKSLRTGQQNQKCRGNFHPLPINWCSFTEYVCMYVCVCIYIYISGSPENLLVLTFSCLGSFFQGVTLSFAICLNCDQETQGMIMSHQVRLTNKAFRK